MDLTEVRLFRLGKSGVIFTERNFLGGTETGELLKTSGDIQAAVSLTALGVDLRDSTVLTRLREGRTYRFDPGLLGNFDNFRHAVDHVKGSLYQGVLPRSVPIRCHRRSQN